MNFSKELTIIILEIKEVISDGMDELKKDLWEYGHVKLEAEK